MEVSKIKNVNVTSPDAINSISQTKNNEKLSDVNFSSKNQIKTIQINDFFNLLDEKTVKKLMETSSESKARIIKDITQMEYDENGARAILSAI